MLSLAEAILLGSTMVKPMRGMLYEEASDGEWGCALGMAYKAMGYVKNGLCSVPLIDFDMMPVLGLPTQLPCNCNIGITYALSNAIAHLFDSHVVINGKTPRYVVLNGCPQVFKNPWTLEQLVDWVRTQEAKIQPTEEAKDADRVTDHAQCSH